MVFCLAHYLALNQTRSATSGAASSIPWRSSAAFAASSSLSPTSARRRSPSPWAAPPVRFRAPSALHPADRRALAAALRAHGRATTRTGSGGSRPSWMSMGNKQGGTYQLYQSLEAFAAGGTSGRAWARGASRSNFLPEAHTDFIFRGGWARNSACGSRSGSWRVFAVMFVAGLAHLRRAPNLFHFLLATGCLPAHVPAVDHQPGRRERACSRRKGMSLPFISAGLSQLLLHGPCLWESSIKHAADVGQGRRSRPGGGHDARGPRI